MNFLADAIAQPILTSLIESFLWVAIFRTSGTLGGFTREYYLSYVLWGSFFARINSSWSYEFQMIREIETGSVNAFLSRPATFFEYYLSQLLGYKTLVTIISLLFPFAAIRILNLPTIFSRIPMALIMTLYYVVLVHTMSMCVCSFAFFFNRVSSLTVAKNLSLTILSGELFPIDLAPPALKSILLSLPFASAVYVPVGYLTGRIDFTAYMKGLWNITWGLAVFGVLSAWIWRMGLRKYSGTGA